MAVISVFNGFFCRGGSVVREVLDRTGYELITDQDLVEEASRLFDMPETKVEMAFSPKTSVFNKFTHEHERCLAVLRLALAQILNRDKLLIFGHSGHMVPGGVNHVLRVCLIGDVKFRTSVAMEQEGLLAKDALNLIRRQDGVCAAWVRHLHGKDDPWSSFLYDMVIPMDKTSVEEAADLIDEHTHRKALERTEASKRALEDFLLTARVQEALTREGHEVVVQTRGGSVTLIIARNILMLQREEDELKSIVSKVEGVTSVETKKGKDFYHTDIYHKHDSGTPSKVLLVDDEREFIQTLSTRLLLRDMCSVAVYDGESALKLVEQDAPEVMILDLRMPGIDGIEVLRRVKEIRPEVEIIILTGHGTSTDRERCKEFGAFAYFAKPIDTDLLSDTVKMAYEEVRKRRGKRNRSM